MSEPEIYIHQGAQHNKFWSWERDGNDVVFRWGRIGQTGQSSRKRYDMSLINKKVSEKVRKGYEKTDEGNLKKEERTAELMGAQHKIADLRWVDKAGKKLDKISEYDPDKWVFVKIMNSWSKAETYLLLSKTESHELHGIKDGGNKISFTRTSYAPGDFVRGVREHLKGLAKKVKKILQNVFGKLGNRNLFGDDVKEEEREAVTKQFKKAAKGESMGVLKTFASLGTREIAL